MKKWVLLLPMVQKISVAFVNLETIAVNGGSDESNIDNDNN